MPRRKLTLDPGEARDSEGWIHKAIQMDKMGLYFTAKCEPIPLGRNPSRLKGYCRECYPHLYKDLDLIELGLIHPEPTPESEPITESPKPLGKRKRQPNQAILNLVLNQRKIRRPW